MTPRTPSANKEIFLMSKLAILQVCCAYVNTFTVTTCVFL